MAVPSRVSGPRVGVVPRACSGADLMTGAALGGAFAGVLVGTGTVNFVSAAGGRIGSGRFGASAGGSACTGRALIDVTPPLSGPLFPPASMIVITGLGSIRGALNQRPGVRINNARIPACASTEMAAMRSKPPGGPVLSRRTSLTSTSNVLGIFRDEADVDHARVAQRVEHAHQLLQRDGAVAAQVHLLVLARGQLLLHEVLHGVRRDAFRPDKHHIVGAKR